VSFIPDSYPFQFIMNEGINKEGHIKNIWYKFKSTKSNLWYIVLVEQYEHEVFAVKFYPKA
jgi:hypothetical protein